MPGSDTPLEGQQGPGTSSFIEKAASGIELAQSTRALNRVLTCFRIGCWTALATWNVCFMLNMPGPLITPSELTCNLQCAPELWDAKDEEAFHVACDDLEFHHSLDSASPAYLVSTLMGEEWPGPTGAPFKHVPLSGLQQSLMGEFAARQNFSFAYDSLFLRSIDHDDYLSATHVSLVLFCPSSTPRHLAMARSLETGN